MTHLQSPSSFFLLPLLPTSFTSFPVLFLLIPISFAFLHYLLFTCYPSSSYSFNLLPFIPSLPLFPHFPFYFSLPSLKFSTPFLLRIFFYSNSFPISLRAYLRLPFFHLLLTISLLFSPNFSSFPHLSVFSSNCVSTASLYFFLLLLSHSSFSLFSPFFLLSPIPTPTFPPSSLLLKPSHQPPIILLSIFPFISPPLSRLSYNYLACFNAKA